MLKGDKNAMDDEDKTIEDGTQHRVYGVAEVYLLFYGLKAKGTTFNRQLMYVSPLSLVGLKPGKRLIFNKNLHIRVGQQKAF